MRNRGNKKPFIILLGITLKWFFAAVALLFVGVLIGEINGAGEQNIPGWIFIAILYNPIILIASIVSIYVVVYLYFNSQNRDEEWAVSGSEEHEREVSKASKYIDNPVRIDVYAKNNNLEISDIEERLGKGALRGYVLNGKTYIKNA
ncbi:MAG: hypothetical protein KAT25_11085 [Sulfuriflexus sp.]|nr:hypothetical protein [Sulfuriflexus sp.]